MGKSQVDGDAAPLLLFQAIGVGPRQRADQGGLSVVDVTRRAHNHVFHKLSRQPSAFSKGLSDPVGDEFPNAPKGALLAG